MLTQIIFKRTFRRMIKNKEKVLAYMSNLGTWETRLNDETRMLMQSIRSSVDVEKFIHKNGRINVSGFMNHIKKYHPRFYNSKMYQKYNKEVIHLQRKIRYEKQVINKYTRWFNEDVLTHLFLSKIWGFERIPFKVWNIGRDINAVSEEFNEVPHVRF